MWLTLIKGTQLQFKIVDNKLVKCFEHMFKPFEKETGLSLQSVDLLEGDDGSRLREDTQTDRQTDSQDRQTDGQAGRQVGTQADRESVRLCFIRELVFVGARLVQLLHHISSKGGYPDFLPGFDQVLHYMYRGRMR